MGIFRKVGYEGAGWDRFKGNVKGREPPSSFLVLALAFVLYLWDWIYGFNGFSFDDVLQTPWKYILAIPLNVFLFVNMFLFLMKPTGARVLFSRFALTAVVLDVLMLGGFSGGGLGHLIIPLLIWFLWARNVYEDEASANMIIASLMIFDFVGYGLLQFFVSRASWSTPRLLEMLSNRLIIPIWGYYALFSSYQYEKDSLATFLLVLLLGMNIFYLVDDSAAFAGHMGYLDPEMRFGFWEYATTGFNRFWGEIKKAPQKLQEGYDAQMEYATGGYYKGQVEEKAEEPLLGVFIENIMLSQQKYFQDEPVIIWADLRARTLKDPIGIIMNCTTGEDDSLKPGELKPDYFPDKSINFNITTLEEESLQCKFSSLPPGTHTVKLSAEFNFETMAYLKTYFMDIERIRALRRDGIDPLGQYGIKDKKPVAVYTNGPVKIGIGTNTQLPIGLGRDYIQNPRLGITIENQWNGKIKNINNLIVQIPRSMKLEAAEGGKFCNGWFKKIDNNKLDETLQDDNYLSYGITKDGLKTFKFPIGAFETLRCIIEIDESNVRDVLGNTPYATHYYRADVKYVYYSENSISVNVVKVPGEKTKLTDCDEKCQDSDGCKCVNADCKNYNKYAAQGKDCGGPKEDSEESIGSSGAPTDLRITIRSLGGSEDETSSLNVKLELYAKNANSCRYKNDGDDWGEWELVEPTKEWALKEGDEGQKNVCFQCRNSDGESEACDEIEYNLS